MSTEFREGDLVEAIKGEERRTGRVTRPGEHLRMQGTCLHDYERDGYTLAVIEKVASKLPSEPGSVLRGTGPNQSILMRRYPVNGHEPEGPWVSIGGVTYSDDEAVRFFHGQFTPLEPVRVTASRVLDAIDASFTPGCDRIFTYGAAQRIAGKFGVTK